MRKFSFLKQIIHLMIKFLAVLPYLPDLCNISNNGFDTGKLSFTLLCINQVLHVTHTNKHKEELNYYI